MQIPYHNLSSEVSLLVRLGCQSQSLRNEVYDQLQLSMNDLARDVFERDFLEYQAAHPMRLSEATHAIRKNFKTIRILENEQKRTLLRLFDQVIAKRSHPGCLMRCVERIIQFIQGRGFHTVHEQAERIKKRLNEICSSPPSYPPSRDTYTPSTLDVPPEIWSGAFSYLTMKERGIASSVCKDWNHIINSSKQFWESPFSKGDRREAIIHHVISKGSIDTVQDLSALSKLPYFHLVGITSAGLLAGIDEDETPLKIHLLDPISLSSMSVTSMSGCEFSTLHEFFYYFESVSVSPNGQYMVRCGNSSLAKLNLTIPQVDSLYLEGYTTSLAFTPDSRYVTWCAERQFHKHNLMPELGENWPFPDFAGVNNISSHAISQNAQRIAISQGNQCFVYQGVNLLHTLDIGRRIDRLTISPDGMRLVTELGQAGEVALWDLLKGSRLTVLDGQLKTNARARSVFSPDGHYIVQPRKNKLLFFNGLTGTQVSTFTLLAKGEWIQEVLFAPDGNSLIFINNGRMHRINLYFPSSVQ